MYFHGFAFCLVPQVQFQDHIFKVLVLVLESESKTMFYGFGLVLHVQVQDHVFMVLVLVFESKSDNVSTLDTSAQCDVTKDHTTQHVKSPTLN